MFDATKGIVQSRGIGGLYAGLGVTIMEIMPYAALQFGIYDSLTAAWQKAKVCMPCGRASVCTRVQACITWLVFAIKSARDYVHACRRCAIARDRTCGQATKTNNLVRACGTYALFVMRTYSGYIGMLCRVYLQANDIERRRIQSAALGRPTMPPPLWHDDRFATFVCGLVAGLCSKLATHPLDVAKKRYQIAGLQRSLR